MRAVLLIPFAYFYETRLRNNSILFHALFEWLAAAVLAVFVGTDSAPQALAMVVLSYLAFISLYEIGYLANDLFASRREADGRRRGPQDAGLFWVSAFVLLRLVAFLLLTKVLDKQSSQEWWSFYLGLAVVFGLHNLFRNAELKTITFLWLAWFRFMAPIIFVVEYQQRIGIGLAAAMSYCAFRLLGYLDSKGLLQMQYRRETSFRLMIFVLPLAGVLVFWSYAEARGFSILCGYFAIVSILGSVFTMLRPRSWDKGKN